MLITHSVGLDGLDQLVLLNNLMNGLCSTVKHKKHMMIYKMSQMQEIELSLCLLVELDN
jgi:hypothetical protein